MEDVVEPLTLRPPHRSRNILAPRPGIERSWRKRFKAVKMQSRVGGDAIVASQSTVTPASSTACSASGIPLPTMSHRSTSSSRPPSS